MVEVTTKPHYFFGQCTAKGLVEGTDYTDFLYTLPGQAKQAYSVPARYATVPCNVFTEISRPLFAFTGLSFKTFKEILQF